MFAPINILAMTEADYRTLNSYQEQAEQLMGQGDPNGAALTIGKAALLASQIIKGPPKGESGRLEDLLASFYRTQEHAYRAIALFQQSGSQPPASSGVCQTLAQSSTQYSRTTTILKSLPSREIVLPTLHQQLKEWEEMLREIEKDLGCVR